MQIVKRAGFVEYLHSLAADRQSGLISAVIKSILLFLSVFYYLAVKIISLGYLKGLFKRYRVSSKVLSVGNITVGGTGKTPLVSRIAEYLKNKGYKVAVLSRGYKRKAAGCGLRAADCDKMGDEPFMLTRQLKDIPVLAGRDRIKTAQQAVAQYRADAVILDDGFQHWRLNRDLDIVLVDSSNPFGNGNLLPRGILREPVSSLSRADIIVLTKTDMVNSAELLKLKETLECINSQSTIFCARHIPSNIFRLKDRRTLFPPDIIMDKKVCLVSSIADCSYFKRLILGLGAFVELDICFSDHHTYCQNDLEEVFSLCKKNNLELILTTEKDAVKLESINLDKFSQTLIYVLKIDFKIIDNEDEFFSRLSDLFKY